MAAIGFGTSYELVDDADEMWTPQDSYTVRNGNWIADESGFDPEPRYFSIMVYREDKSNTLSLDAMDLTFEALEAVMKTTLNDGETTYESVCSTNPSNKCDIFGPTAFFNNSKTVYEETVGGSENALANALSSPFYSDGVRVSRTSIFGNAESVNLTQPLTSTLFFMTTIGLPTVDMSSDVEDFEKEALDKILDMRDRDNGEYRIEVIAERSTSDESAAAASKDLPLIAIAFLVMFSYISVILGSCKDKVKSQALLGVGSVIGILLSCCVGYGTSLLCGFPLTTIALILPFILVGIGLDDTFILTGELALTDPEDTLYNRFSDMIMKGGMAITITTTTNILAFVLGATSSIPAISWFCVYATFSIFFDYLIQITFVCAMMYLDEKRVLKGEKYDCCVCVSAKAKETENSNELAGEEKESAATRMIGIYTDFILQPKMKIVILLFFLAMFIAGIAGIPFVEEDFDPLSLLASDSYVVEFANTREELNSKNDAVNVGVYFRGLNPANVDDSDAMENFVADIVALPYVNDEIGAPSFWLYDYYAKREQEIAADPSFEDLTFGEALEIFLEDESFSASHSANIICEGEGKNKIVVNSRTYIPFTGIGTDAMKGVEALDDQLQVTRDQPYNDGLDSNGEWVMFTQANEYYNWEFFAVIRPNLSQTVILGLVSVFVVTMFALPDPRMSLIVFATVFVIDVELLALIPLAGLNVDPLTFLALTMAIGLVVDYCAHIVHAYLEAPKPVGITRDEIMRKVMTEIGLSILTGAFSTFLGVCILGFSSSTTFQTIFKMMLGIVCLGVGHGFIFMPVVLSLVGPIVNPGDQGKKDVAVIRESMMINMKKSTRSSIKNLFADDEVIDAA